MDGGREEIEREKDKERERESEHSMIKIIINLTHTYIHTYTIPVFPTDSYPEPDIYSSPSPPTQMDHSQR